MGKYVYNESIMDTKLVWLFMFVGSTAGGFVPMLWGDSALSLAAVVWGGIGGILGIWFGYKISRY
jgi:hypothetical protein